VGTHSIALLPSDRSNHAVEADRACPRRQPEPVMSPLLADTRARTDPGRTSDRGLTPAVHQNRAWVLARWLLAARPIQKSQTNPAALPSPRTSTTAMGASAGSRRCRSERRAAATQAWPRQACRSHGRAGSAPVDETCLRCCTGISSATTPALLRAERTPPRLWCVDASVRQRCWRFVRRGRPFRWARCRASAATGWSGGVAARCRARQTSGHGRALGQLARSDRRRPLRK
jgi:hypothetical protein